MKDLEKIKSEDLAAQVQDANPGNFAIEQEVAQLVGATVPQPTQPSADDARELGAQLLVFLRRALLPIQTALRTAVAAIYAHLDSRCTDYPCAAYDPFRLPAGPYDPMRPFVPRTLPNLLQALTAFSARKISNGSAPSDGIPDGISLARLLCADYADVTKLYDDTKGWVLTKDFLSVFPNAKSIHFGCKKIDRVIISAEEATLDELEEIDTSNTWFGGGIRFSGKVLRLPKLHNVIGYIEGSTCVLISSDTLEVLEMPSMHYIVDAPGWHCNFLGGPYGTSYGVTATSLRRLQVGRLDRFGWNFGEWYSHSAPCLPNFIDFEIGAGTAINLDFSKWNPTNVLADADKTATFLQNFKEHIALRLTANGSGLTLTLSQAVFSAVIEGSSPICDDIKGIIEDKGWKVQD